MRASKLYYKLFGGKESKNLINISKKICLGIKALPKNYRDLLRLIHYLSHVFTKYLIFMLFMLASELFLKLFDVFRSAFGKYLISTYLKQKCSQACKYAVYLVLFASLKCQNIFWSLKSFRVYPIINFGKIVRQMKSHQFGNFCGDGHQKQQKINDLMSLW